MRFLPASPTAPTHGPRPSLSPAQVISLAFGLAIALGTLLLSLPAAQAPGNELGLLGALFTATSAVCVTGLVLVDTGVGWTPFGQVVILLLIQIGGLGILTFGSFFAFLIGRRISFRERLRLQTEVNALQTGGIVRLVRGILLFTFGSELLGALVLWVRFAELYGPGQGAYYAVFHAVSAFNNAGFAFYPDSLLRFSHDPLVLLTLAALFILGGLGLLVVVGTALHLADRRRPFTLHTRLVLLTSGALLLGATLLILLFEWANPATLGPLAPPLKLLNAFFQAATPRTAGFNSLDYASMREVSVVLTMLLMFIGASPASTGGGIKNVTFMVVLLSAFSEVRGRDEITAFKRRIPTQTVLKAGTIVLFSLLLLALVLVLLTLTDPQVPFLPLAFEAFSAFGTVGLSLGVTSGFSPLGQLLLIVLMYVGRLGPVTFALALTRKRPEHDLRYPAEDVVIG